MVIFLPIDSSWEDEGAFQRKHIQMKTKMLVHDIPKSSVSGTLEKYFSCKALEISFILPASILHTDTQIFITSMIL